MKKKILIFVMLCLFINILNVDAFHDTEEYEVYDNNIVKFKCDVFTMGPSGEEFIKNEISSCISGKINIPRG